RVEGRVGDEAEAADVDEDGRSADEGDLGEGHDRSRLVPPSNWSCGTPAAPAALHCSYASLVSQAALGGEGVEAAVAEHMGSEGERAEHIGKGGVANVETAGERAEGGHHHARLV